MKNFKIFTLFFVLVSVQFSFGQTTLEEYNYISKGYKDDILKGKTLKYGYKFLGLGQWSLSYNEKGRSFERQVHFQEVIRVSDRKICATVMIYQKTDLSDTHYFCIPDHDSSPEIWNLFFQDLKFFDQDLAIDALLTVVYGTMRLMTNEPKILSPTTYEEYNYMRNGYRDDMKMGRSIKWGYSMIDIGSWGLPYPQFNGPNFQRNVEFKGFFKHQDQKISGILATYKRTDTNFTQDFCIPHTEDNMMWSSVLEDLKTLGKNREALFSMSYALLRCASYLKSQQKKQIRAYLGVTISTDLKILSIPNDSPNRYSGIQVGDKIVSLNWIPISNSNQLFNAIRQLQVGDKVNIVVERGGYPHHYFLTLGSASQL